MAPPKQVVLTPPPPWYNGKPQTSMPILGTKGGTDIRDIGFQQFLLAANKRMVRQWMGELKHMVGTDAGQLAYLYRWFGTSDGQDHFRQWAQKLGCMIGYRPPNAAAHTAGKGCDINYEFNGWCPLCANHAGPPETFTMIGETQDAGVNVSMGKLYDRALRIFVPIHASEPDDPHGAKYFARKFYRNHWDWQLPQLNQPAPTATEKLPVDYVYRCYQTLNWSLMFYLNYGFDRLSVQKQDTNTQNQSVNSAAHGPALADTQIWPRIKDDIDKGNLPATSELLCDPGMVGTDAAVHFESLQMTYPFSSKTVNVLRLPLNPAKAAEIATAQHEQIVGATIKAQLVADHKTGASGLVYTAPQSRDPCWGVFNHSYEFVLATAGLLSDVKQVRCFGSFVEMQSGDMQHFDYGFRSRPY